MVGRSPLDAEADHYSRAHTGHIRALLSRHAGRRLPAAHGVGYAALREARVVDAAEATSRREVAERRAAERRAMEGHADVADSTGWYLTHPPAYTV